MTGSEPAIRISQSHLDLTIHLELDEHPVAGTHVIDRLE